MATDDSKVGRWLDDHPGVDLLLMVAVVAFAVGLVLLAVFAGGPHA